jgi:hypothetical protein
MGSTRIRIALSAAALGALLLGVAPVYHHVHAAPSGKAETKDKKKDKKGGKSAEQVLPTGTPAMWRDVGDVASLDLFWGIGSAQGAPKPPFTFVKEDVTGTNPKIKVTDANGVKWNMKFDEEVHAEVAASRIVWAMGYMVEESYYVPSGKVDGVTGLGRAKKFIGADGSFQGAMFEKRPEEITRRATPWAWDSNPFNGTKELSGLAVIAVLLNNWDAKVDNNNVLAMKHDDGSVKEWYLVADWGGTFGKMGGVFSHSKWDPEAYAKQEFIKGVSGSTLQLNYTGKGGNVMKGVPVEHARWISARLSQLTDDQIRQAFRAAGATDTDTAAFAGRIRAKIQQLKAAVGN